MGWGGTGRPEGEWKECALEDHCAGRGGMEERPRDAVGGRELTPEPTDTLGFAFCLPEDTGQPLASELSFRPLKGGGRALQAMEGSAVTLECQTEQNASKELILQKPEARGRRLAPGHGDLAGKLRPKLLPALH